MYYHVIEHNDDFCHVRPPKPQENKEKFIPMTNGEIYEILANVFEEGE